MDDFQPLTNLVGRLPTSYSDNPTAPGELGKNDFLQLLMVQLGYQDPMNPMDVNQMSTQLAQFTTVEELQNLNTSTEQALEADIILAQSINNTMSTTLIGKNVKALGGVVKLTDGEASPIGYDLNEAASELSITIRDSSGNIVRTFSETNLPKGEGTVTWDGKDDDGNDVTDGYYTVGLSSVDYLGNQVDTTPYLIGKVEAVQYGASGAILIVNGQEVAFGDVIEISEADSDESLLDLLGL